MKKLKRTDIEYRMEIFELIGCNIQKELDALNDKYINFTLEDSKKFVLNNIPNGNSLDLDHFKTLQPILQITLYYLFYFNKNKIVYNITDNLHTKILNTSIKSVDSSFINSPHTFFYLNFQPDSKLVLNKEYISSVMIEYNKDLDTKRFDFLIIFNEHNLLDIYIELKSGDIFKQIKKQLFNSKIDTRLRDDLLNIFLPYFINFILCVNTPSIDKEYVKSSKHLIKSKKKKRKVSKYSYINIGSKQKLTTEDKKYYQSSKNNLKLLKWVVRGHWRNQKYGQKNSFRKLIWIEPHIKGSEIENNLEMKEFKITI